MDPFAAEIDDNDTVFVSGLPTNVTEEDLASYFGQIGILCGIVRALMSMA